MKFVDSSFIVDVFRGNSAAKEYLETMSAGEQLLTSTIVAKEIFTGEFLADPTVPDIEVTRSLAWVSIIEYTEEHALESARIHAELNRSGRMVNRTDILIAGTPRSMNLPVVARDRDYDRIDGLTVEGY